MEKLSHISFIYNIFLYRTLTTSISNTDVWILEISSVKEKTILKQRIIQVFFFKLFFKSGAQRNFNLQKQLMFQKDAMV